MPCDTIFDDHGNPIGIACSRGTRAARCGTPDCNAASVALCDYPLAGRKAGKTCDRRMCTKCRTSVGKNVDHCPAHARAAAKSSGAPEGEAAEGDAGVPHSAGQGNESRQGVRGAAGALSEEED